MLFCYDTRCVGAIFPFRQGLKICDTNLRTFVTTYIPGHSQALGSYSLYNITQTLQHVEMLTDKRHFRIIEIAVQFLHQKVNTRYCAPMEKDANPSIWQDLDTWDTKIDDKLQLH